jgi:hypothetical protein
MQRARSSPVSRMPSIRRRFLICWFMIYRFRCFGFPARSRLTLQSRLSRSSRIADLKRMVPWLQSPPQPRQSQRERTRSPLSRIPLPLLRGSSISRPRRTRLMSASLRRKSPIRKMHVPSPLRARPLRNSHRPPSASHLAFLLRSSPNRLCKGPLSAVLRVRPRQRICSASSQRIALRILRQDHSEVKAPRRTPQRETSRLHQTFQSRPEVARMPAPS